MIMSDKRLKTVGNHFPEASFLASSSHKSSDPIKIDRLVVIYVKCS